MDNSEQSPEKYVYNHIPNLRDLLSTNAGLPGVEYAQVTLENLYQAQKSGWSKLSGHQKIYIIRGPKGEVACELYGKGKPIKGQNTMSGKRICWIDKAIRLKTGLGLKGPIQEPEKIEPSVEKTTTQKSVEAKVGT